VREPENGDWLRRENVLQRVFMMPTGACPRFPLDPTDLADLLANWPLALHSARRGGTMNVGFGSVPIAEMQRGVANMGCTLVKIGSAAAAVIVLATLGGCVPPMAPPASSGVTASPGVTGVVLDGSDCLPLETPAPPSPEERIVDTLDEPITTPFAGRSLFDLAAYCERSCGVDLVIDQAALNKEAIEGGMPAVGATLSDVSLGCLLDALLDPMDLAWTIRNERLTITTKEVAAKNLVLKTHDVTELVSRSEGNAMASYQCLALVHTIQKHFAPPPGEADAEWIEAITVGNATVLVFPHEHRMHRRIERFLEELRVIARQHASRAS